MQVGELSVLVTTDVQQTIANWPKTVHVYYLSVRRSGLRALCSWSPALQAGCWWDGVELVSLFCRMEPPAPEAACCSLWLRPSSSLRPKEIPAAWSLSPPGVFSEDSPKEVRGTRIICHLNTESQTCRIPSPLPIIMGVIGSIVSQKYMCKS